MDKETEVLHETVCTKVVPKLLMKRNPRNFVDSFWNKFKETQFFLKKCSAFKLNIF